MSSHTAETPTSQQVELLADLEVCLECFNLRGRFEEKEHRCNCVPRDDEWREREWVGGTYRPCSTSAISAPATR